MQELDADYAEKMKAGVVETAAKAFLEARIKELKENKRGPCVGCGKPGEYEYLCYSWCGNKSRDEYCSDCQERFWGKA